MDGVDGVDGAAAAGAWLGGGAACVFSFGVTPLGWHTPLASGLIPFGHGALVAGGRDV
jgi:hypothetical protein